MNKVRINVYLKPKTHKRLKKYAEDEYMKISEAINEIIDIYLDVNDVKRIKKTLEERK